MNFYFIICVKTVDSLVLTEPNQVDPKQQGGSVLLDPNPSVQVLLGHLNRATPTGSGPAWTRTGPRKKKLNIIFIKQEVLRKPKRAGPDRTGPGRTFLCGLHVDSDSGLGLVPVLHKPGPPDSRSGPAAGSGSGRKNSKKKNGRAQKTDPG